MKQRNWLLIGLLVILLAGSALYAIVNQHNTTITVKTNGSAVNIESSIWIAVPDAMISEMRQKGLQDVDSSASNVESIRADMQSIARKYNFTVQVNLVSQFGENQLPMAAVVRGTSMVPTLQDGQNIVVLKTQDFKVGDLVVARHPDYNLIVKRVADIQGDQVYLKSDNRQVEIIGNQIRTVNGVQQVVTIEKTPLDTWLPKTNVVGVVKVY